MRGLFCFFLLLSSCTPTSGKVSVESDVSSDTGESGADSEGSAEDDEESEDETDDLWERVNGWSIVTDGAMFGLDGDVWVFMQDVSEDDDSTKDDHDEREAGPACVMNVGDWEPICIAFIGDVWGTAPELEPEDHCNELDGEEEADWRFTDEGCETDPKAFCMLEETSSLTLKMSYYSPMPLSDARESCEEAEGTFYPLMDEEDEDDEDDEQDLGTRWMGYVPMDNSWGVASFEHFTESGENCKAEAPMLSVRDVEACDGCEFSKTFQVGEFDYQIDEGGCPRGELDDTEGVFVTVGHGTTVFRESDGMEFHTLMILADD